MIGMENIENVEFNHNQKLLPQHLQTKFAAVATIHNGKSIKYISEYKECTRALY